METIAMNFNPPHEALLRYANQTFCLAAFDERRFDNDHAHCMACWQKIAEPQRVQRHEPIEYDGYVTVHAVSAQYHWVCKTCFAQFGERYGWQVSETLPEIS
ncbi:MAG: hypothetical protein HYZ37_18925 [Candidatus Solibacter usitatus]|nr:hypothetical protein [Candidatus Solibacter usitatus]